MKKTILMMNVKRGVLAITLFVLPQFVHANMNGACISDKEIYTFFALVIFLLVNYPVSMVLANTAQKKGSASLAFFSALLGSVYMVLWSTCLYFNLINSGESETLALFMLLFLVAIFPMMYTWRRFIQLVRKKRGGGE